MARPRGYYVVFLSAMMLTICHGYAEARRLSPERAYVRHTDRVKAEEYAAWWRYDHPHWTEK